MNRVGSRGQGAVKHRRARGDSGLALAEFALVLPIFATLLLGLVSSGIVLNQKIQLSHATREGARHGASVPAGQPFSSGTWASNVRDVVVSRSAGDLEAAEVCVALVAGVTPVPVGSDTTTNSDGSACFDDSATAGPELRVQVRAARTGKIEAVIISQDVTLVATATAKLEPDG